MAQYFLDASDYNLSDGFAETPWSLVFGGISLEVKDDGNGDRYFEFISDSDDREVVEVNHGLTLTGQVDLYCLWSSERDDHICIYMSGASSSDIDLISANPRTPDDDYRLVAFDDGSFNEIAEVSESTLHSEIHNVRLTSDGAWNHEIRIWAREDSEPGTAQVEGSYQVAYGDGVGVLMGSRADEEVRIYRLGVGTDGDPAPTGPIVTAQGRFAVSGGLYAPAYQKGGQRVPVYAKGGLKLP